MMHLLILRHHRLYQLKLIHCNIWVLKFTSICLLLKTLLRLELKEAPENMEVIGYVKSKTFLNTDVISCEGKLRSNGFF